jgi:ABC-2 type transport system ATP-binding protein
VAEEGVGVLWATHLFDEIEADDAVVLLHEGRVISRGTASEIAGGRALDAAFLEKTGLGREALA